MHRNDAAHSERDSCVAVRNIRPTDASAYVDLLHRIDTESRFLAWEPGERPLDNEVLRTRIDHADPSTRLHLLATRGDQLVGFLVGHRATLRRVRHRADFTIAVLLRFHRRGVGSQLLDALHEWAAAQHIERVELTVMSHNPAAIAFYHRAGYHQEGIKRGSMRIDGRPIDEIMMARTIETAQRRVRSDVMATCAVRVVPGARNTTSTEPSAR